VHPGAGTEAPTLVEGLLCDRQLPESDDPTRPGIVHRLDKDTSGVIVVAKTAAALTHLQNQFAARSVRKTYVAVVSGVLAEDEATIDAPVGRDPANPRKMSIQVRGKPAQTDIRVLERFDDSTLLVAYPHTGRTHQLRVHLVYIEHPVLGDSIYGSSGPRDRARAGYRSLRDQAQAGDLVHGRGTDERLFLHAWRLTVEHPGTGELVTFEAPVPTEFPEYDYDALP
jgi:23S rRNA pseudouridine1911/1915/1917 synthase